MKMFLRKVKYYFNYILIGKRWVLKVNVGKIFDGEVKVKKCGCLKGVSIIRMYFESMDYVCFSYCYYIYFIIGFDKY